MNPVLRSSMRVAAAAVAAVATFVLAIAASFVGAPTAHAQSDQSVEPAPLLSVGSVEATPAQTTVVVDVALEPGDLAVGAISAQITWDRSQLLLVECTVGDLTVCNDIETAVAVAGFAPSGYEAQPQFVSLELAVIDRSAPVEVAVGVETIADVRGIVVDDIVTQDGTVSFVGEAPLAGGVNGEVVDGTGAGVFAAEVCAISMIGDKTCSATSGLGAFVMDGLVPGSYLLVVTDPTGAFATAEQTIEVQPGEMTVGVSIAMAPAGTGAPEVDGEGPEIVTLVEPVDALEPLEAPDASEDTSLTAAEGEIAVQVVAATGGSAIFGAEVCATMPVVGTGHCAFTDRSGIARLAGLAVGNYELTATDAAQRFDPAPAVFVGLNPGQGATAELVMPTVGFGAPPEELAFVEAADDGDRTGLVLSSVGFAGLLALGVARRRTREDRD